MGLLPEVFYVSDGGSEDTNGRSEPGIGFGFIGQFSDECLSGAYVLVK